MPLYSLTKDKVDELQAKIQAKEDLVAELERLTVEDLWTRELDKFEDAYRKDLKAKGFTADSSEVVEHAKEAPAPKPTVKPAANPK